MKVLVVNPCARPDPYGFSNWSSEVGRYLQALQKAGHEVKALTTAGYDESELRSALSQDQRSMVLVYTPSRQADQARAIGAFYALHYSQSDVFFCGPHASAWPADCLNVAQNVYVLRGYVEHLLADLASLLEEAGDFFSLPGLSFPVTNRFYHNTIEASPEISEREAPDRLISNYPELIANFASSLGAEIDTSYGDFNTSSRSQACFDLSAPKTGLVIPHQQRSVSQVLAEAKSLQELLPDLRFLGLRDADCLAHEEWVKELCEAWPKHVGLPFWVVSRPEFLKESIFEALAQGGCYRLFVPIEAGSDHVRRRVIGRQYSRSHLLYLARACRRFGISLITMNEIGFPGETEDMIQETIYTNRRMRPDWALCSIFHPLPGSAVFQHCESKKWLSQSSYGIFYDPEIRVEQPWVRPKKIDVYLQSFHNHVFDKAETKSYHRQT